MKKAIYITIILAVLAIVVFVVYKLFFEKKKATATAAIKLKPGETIEEAAKRALENMKIGGVEEGEFTRNGQEPARTMDMTNLRLWQR